jgi:hypothetical protein
MKRIKTCSRCVYNETHPRISFDSEGVCNYCKIYDEMCAENILLETAQIKK